MGKTKIVKAKKVKAGDLLPGLGDGYVFEDAEPCDPRYIPGFGEEGWVMITFHDNDGEENYLILGKDNPVTVTRER